MNMNTNRLIWAVAVILLCGLTESKGKGMEWVYSTDSAKWVQRQTIDAASASDAEKTDITVFPDRKLQEIDGFGWAFNELGWEALQTLSPGKRAGVIQALFSPDGANFTMGRIPIGVSDYALSYYSLDDVPEDFSMRNFNIDRD